MIRQKAGKKFLVITGMPALSFCPVFDAKKLTLIRTKKCNDVTFLYSKVT